jgi:hypothetical protein
MGVDLALSPVYRVPLPTSEAATQAMLPPKIPPWSPQFWGVTQLAELSNVQGPVAEGPP